MLQNAFIDIAIGLILMYLMLSLLCTSINEYIATVLKLRAKGLEGAIQVLLDQPDLLKNFYNHGLIDGTHDASGGHPSYFDGKTVAMALIGALDPTKPLPGYADVEKSVLALPADSNIRAALLTALTNANGSLERVRSAIADWYDNAMDRLSGTYKRNIKWISLGVGIVIAAGLNADSLRVGRTLWSDPALRGQVGDVAGSYLKACGSACLENTKDSGTLKGVKLAIDNGEQTLRPLPIGWPEPIPTDSACAFFWWFVQKFAGLLATGVALSLGAPFWFDLLSKFVKLRGTGEKPDRANA